MVRVLKSLDVTLTWCNPTEITMLAAAAKAAGLRPDRDFPALRAMFTAAEPLSEVRRRRLSEIWGGIPVVEEYGSTETGTIAGQCPEGRLHLWADRAVFEVYDPATGELSPTGRGQMVVTPSTGRRCRCCVTTSPTRSRSRTRPVRAAGCCPR